MDKQVMKLATPGKRLAAYLIDAVMPFVAAIIAICSYISMTAVQTMDPFSMFDVSPSLNLTIGNLTGFLVVVFIIMLYLAIQIYFYTKSKTIGKAIMGLQVINSNDGKPLGLGLMLVRELLAKSASESVLYLGCIWILIDEKRRGWHDKIVESYVIEVPKESVVKEMKDELFNS